RGEDDRFAHATVGAFRPRTVRGAAGARRAHRGHPEGRSRTERGRSALLAGAADRMRRGCVAATLAILAAVSACGQGTGGVQRLSIATGGTGGVYYPYGGGIAQVLTEHLPGVEATAEVTAASVDNLKFLQQGSSDLAFTMADIAQDAL